jgi:hypothetical protein
VKKRTLKGIKKEREENAGKQDQSDEESPNDYDNGERSEETKEPRGYCKVKDQDKDIKKVRKTEGSKNRKNLLLLSEVKNEEHEDPEQSIQSKKDESSSKDIKKSEPPFQIDDGVAAQFMVDGRSNTDDVKKEDESSSSSDNPKEKFSENSGFFKDYAQNILKSSEKSDDEDRLNSSVLDALEQQQRQTFQTYDPTKHKESEAEFIATGDKLIDLDRSGRNNEVIKVVSDYDYDESLSERD